MMRLCASTGVGGYYAVYMALQLIPGTLYFVYDIRLFFSTHVSILFLLYVCHMMAIFCVYRIDPGGCSGTPAAIVTASPYIISTPHLSQRRWYQNDQFPCDGRHYGTQLYANVDGDTSAPCTECTWSFGHDGARGHLPGK